MSPQHLLPSVTGAGCTAEFLTYRCADAILADMVIQEQLEKRHGMNQFTAIPAVFPKRSPCRGTPRTGQRRWGPELLLAPNFTHASPTRHGI